jgi:photosystem II stability/assembly factor-like uncharacterized protein
LKIAVGGPTAQPKLYKTMDAGTSWQEVTGLPQVHIPSGSAVPPLVYCGTFIDGTDVNDVFVQQIVLDPQGAGVAIARALYRSRDGGATWGPPLGTLDRTNGFRDLVVVGSRLIATSEPTVYGARGCSPTDSMPPAQPSTVLYASDDGGHTWQQLGQSIESQHLAVWGLSAMGATIFAQADTLFPGGGCTHSFEAKTSLWRSTDGGTTWQRVTTPPASLSLNLLSFTPRADGTGYYGVALAGGPGGPDASPGAASTVLFSGDSGATWSPLPELDPSLPRDTASISILYASLAVTPSGAVVAQAFRYPIPGGSSGAFAIRPSDPMPAWTSYAPVAETHSRMTTVTSGSTLWALDNYGAAPVLKYLPLP